MDKWDTESKGRRCVGGEYCVGEGKGEKMGGEERSEADGGSCSCFAAR